MEYVIAAAGMQVYMGYGEVSSDRKVIGVSKHPVVFPFDLPHY
jgi:hypothetical protein